MKQVTVTVPGKIMLAGEYAVLRGGSSLANTIDKDLTVKVEQNSSPGVVKVLSSLWDKPVYLDPSLSKSDVHIEPLLESTAACCDRFSCNNATVSVDEGLKVEHGVGSSSALRFGVLLGFETLYGGSKLDQPSDAGLRWDLARECYHMQKSHQNHASGYDIATQNVGGLVMIKPLATGQDMWPGIVTKLGGRQDSLNSLITSYVCNVGANTKTLLNQVLQWLDGEKLWEKLLPLSEELVASFIDIIDNPESDHSKQRMIASVIKHRNFFEQAPGFPRDILESLKTVNGFDESWTFKTTGAGGHDAILIIGNPPEQELGNTLKEIGWEKSSYRFSQRSATVSLEETVH